MIFQDKGIIGPDVSFYQADPRQNQFIDFNKMKEYGVSFVIIKAGQRNYFDPAFAVNRAAARVAGLPRAFYWFLDYRDKGKAQAQFFWNLIKDDPGEGPLIVDFEDGSGGDWRKLYDFIVELQVLSKYPSDRIWIYTGYYYWLDFGPQFTGDELWFIAYRLWIASYTDRVDLVKVPRPWITASMWQKGTTVVYGPDMGVLSLEIDFNIFNGDRELFNHYFLTNYVPDPQEDHPQEEEGESMKYKVVWTKGVAKRTQPTTSNSYTGLLLPYPNEVEVIEDHIDDLNDPSNINKVWVKLADGYYAAKNYPDSLGVPRVRMEKVETPVPDPDPIPDPEPTIVHRIDVYSDGKVAIDGSNPF